MLVWEARMRRWEGREKVDQIPFFKKKNEKKNNISIKKTKKDLENLHKFIIGEMLSIPTGQGNIQR